MSLYRILLITIVLGVAAASFTLIWQIKNTYRALPADFSNEKDPLDLYNGWREFVPESGSFQVLLPTSPQELKKSIPDPETGVDRNYFVYVAEEPDRSTFTITRIAYEKMPEGKDKRDLLKSVVDELLVSNPNNKLLLMGENLFRTYPSLDFSLQNQGAQMDAKAFMVGNEMYILGYLATAENYQRAKFDYFTQSFEPR